MQLLVTFLEQVFQYGQLTSSARLSMENCDFSGSERRGWRSLLVLGGRGTKKSLRSCLPYEEL